MFTLLIAACATTVFSTALMQILVVLLTVAYAVCFSSHGPGCGGAR